ncbi:hypothetical protein EDB80DRAFT_187710 [Ilyonectria destructans]|nr:hypothetical protein EDB80DRAFT_187710 [Ilyonectria destructans]
MWMWCIFKLASVLTCIITTFTKYTASSYSNITSSSTMCLTLIVHEADSDIRFESIINAESGLTVYNPFQMPYCSVVYEKKDQEDNEVPCTKGEWDICNHKDDESACHGWEGFNVVVHSRNANQTIASLISTFGEPVDLLDDMRKTSATQAPYVQVRQAFFAAGQNLAMDAERLNWHKKQFILENGKDALATIRYLRIKLQNSITELEKATMTWEKYAEQGKMELCPSKGFEKHPFASLFEVPPNAGTRMSPNQLLKHTEPLGLGRVHVVEHVGEDLPESPASEIHDAVMTGM